MCLLNKMELKENYTVLKKCYFCKDDKLVKIIEFKNFPLAGGFLTNLEDSINEKFFPMTLLYCKTCKLGYIREIINNDMLFKSINVNNSYFYYSSQIPYLVKHFKKLSEYIVSNYSDKNSLLEIGCNDGVLLNNFTGYEKTFKLIGIDPSLPIKNITNDKITTINDYFSSKTACDILSNHGKIDIIVACNCLAHINNINDIYDNIVKILSDEGVLIIEVHYFKSIIKTNQFDFIYHEHMLYYNMTTFYNIAKKYNLYIDSIEELELHGGSIRVIFRKNHEGCVNYCDENILARIESENELDVLLLDLNNNIMKWRDLLNGLITKIQTRGEINEIFSNDNYFRRNNGNKKLYAYGASGRANTLMEFMNVKFDVIFDDSVSKITKLTPKHHVRIADSMDIYTDDSISHIFILAWPYQEDIIKKHERFLKEGGVFIVVLPEIKIVRF